MPEMPEIGSAASGQNDYYFHLNGIRESINKKSHELNNLPPGQQTADLLMKINTLKQEISSFSEDVEKFHKDLSSSNFKIIQIGNLDKPDNIGDPDINVISQNFLERQRHLEEWGASLEHRIYELNL